jgi:hypothetical protein
VGRESLSKNLKSLVEERSDLTVEQQLIDMLDSDGYIDAFYIVTKITIHIQNDDLIYYHWSLSLNKHQTPYKNKIGLRNK